MSYYKHSKVCHSYFYKALFTQAAEIRFYFYFIFFLVYPMCKLNPNQIHRWSKIWKCALLLL